MAHHNRITKTSAEEKNSLKQPEEKGLYEQENENKANQNRFRNIFRVQNEKGT